MDDDEDDDDKELTAISSPGANTINLDKKGNIIKTMEQLYTKNILVKEVTIPFKNIGNNIEEYLKYYLKKKYEGKCFEEGYIKKNSINLIENGLSFGILKDNLISINIIFECYICRPIEYQIIQCKIVNITIAGIKAEFYIKDNSEKSPIIIFVPKGYGHQNNFSKYKNNDIINLRIVGVKYELNDTFISIIGTFYNENP